MNERYVVQKKSDESYVKSENVEFTTYQVMDLKRLNMGDVTCTCLKRQDATRIADALNILEAMQQAQIPNALRAYIK